MNLKKEAAIYALGLVQSGMTLGLGSGSTTAYFIDLLGEAINSGKLEAILAVPTSERTAEQARKLGIPLTSLGWLIEHRSSAPLLDMAVDGADEVDPQLNLIKGLGRALLREKIIESYTDNFVVIVDESKLAPRLGSKVALPVEILPFEAEAHVHWLNSLGCRAEIWREEDGSPVVTDNGNNLALCRFEHGIEDPLCLARALADRAGIIEHGLFLGMAKMVIVAGAGGIKILHAEESKQIW